MSGVLGRDLRATANEEMRQAAATPLPGPMNWTWMTFAAMGNQSPPKKTRWDVPATGITQALAPRAEGMMDIQKCMTSIKGEFTDKVGSALDLSRTVDKRQQAMGDQLKHIQERVETQGLQSQEQERAIKVSAWRTRELQGQGCGEVQEYQETKMSEGQRSSLAAGARIPRQRKPSTSSESESAATAHGRVLWRARAHKL